MSRCTTISKLCPDVDTQLGNCNVISPAKLALPPHRDWHEGVARTHSAAESGCDWSTAVSVHTMDRGLRRDWEHIGGLDACGQSVCRNAASERRIAPVDHQLVRDTGRATRCRTAAGSASAIEWLRNEVRQPGKSGLPDWLHLQVAMCQRLELLRGFR